METVPSSTHFQNYDPFVFVVYETQRTISRRKCTGEFYYR